MIVYRTAYETVSAGKCLADICLRLRRVEHAIQPALEDMRRLLIDFGEFETGLMDTLSDTVAACSEQTRLTRRASQALGSAFYASYRGAECGGHLRQFGQALGEITRLMVPRTLRRSPSEGYAWYNVSPEAYADAAERYLRERKPRRAVVIGIRGIGSSLSAAVSGAIGHEGVEVRSYTVRPSGHPFDRRLPISDGLKDEWIEQGEADFLIVDEGPGLSGSSFASVSLALADCGISDEHIMIFPSWDAPAACLNNVTARERWSLHRHFAADSNRSWQHGLRDLSAGKWRTIVYGAREDRYPAVQPQHEARKFLTEDGVLLKFAGLGRYGEQKLTRAQALAEAGFSPPVREFRDGFIAYPFVEAARPLTALDVSEALLRRIAEYAAFRAKEFPASRSVDFEELAHMVAQNTGETCDCDSALFESRPTVEIDNRMMPHEWLATKGEILKTDSVDHHADHFYPGDADIAWDLAAAAVEFQMEPAACDYLHQQYTRLSGDRVPPKVQQFYGTAYLAFRTGYTAMAAQAAAGTQEQERFLALQRRYAEFPEPEAALCSTR